MSDESEGSGKNAAAGEPKKSGKGDLFSQLESALEDVKSVAGDIGKKLGKGAIEAQAEAKERWKKLEPRVKEHLKSADKELNELSETASAQLKGLMGELTASLGSLRERFRKDHDGDAGGAAAEGGSKDDAED